MVFVCLIGLSEIIHATKLFFLKSNKFNNKIMLFVLTDEMNDLDFQYILEHISWNGYKHIDKVLCLNRTSSDAKHNLFYNLTKQNGISFIEEDELINIIRSEL